MAGEIDICNIALGHLGDEATLTSIDPPEGSQQAEYCATYYPIARDIVLERHAWKCATTREALVELADVTPPDSWAYAYAVPNGMLKALVLLMPGATDDDDGQDFVIEEVDDENTSKVIYTNVEDAELRFIFRQEDASRFSPLMVVAIARRLAAFLAGPVVKGSEGVKVAMSHLELFEKVELPQAMASDSNGRKKAKYKDFTPSSIAARA